MALPKDNIKHLIVLMLENRSFDHMFGFLTIDRPNKPGDTIDGLSGTESTWRHRVWRMASGSCGRTIEISGGSQR